MRAVIPQAAGSERRRDALRVLRQRINCAVVEHVAAAAGVGPGGWPSVRGAGQRRRLVADLAALTARPDGAEPPAVLGGELGRLLRRGPARFRRYAQEVRHAAGQVVAERTGGPVNGCPTPPLPSRRRTRPPPPPRHNT